MKSTFILVLLALFTVSSCQLAYLPEEPVKFLSQEHLVGAAPGEIVIESNCMENAPFVNGRTKVNPVKVTKGVPINIKVQGQATLKDIQFKEIVVAATLNGDHAYDEKKELKEVAKAGQNFVYSYTAGVPSFIPEGKFEITLNLVDDKGEKVSCLKAEFEF